MSPSSCFQGIAIVFAIAWLFLYRSSRFLTCELVNPLCHGLHDFCCHRNVALLLQFKVLLYSTVIECVDLDSVDLQWLSFLLLSPFFYFFLIPPPYFMVLCFAFSFQLTCVLGPPYISFHDCVSWVVWTQKPLSEYVGKWLFYPYRAFGNKNIRCRQFPAYPTRGWNNRPVAHAS